MTRGMAQQGELCDGCRARFPSLRALKEHLGYDGAALVNMNDPKLTARCPHRERPTATAKAPAPELSNVATALPPNALRGGKRPNPPGAEALAAAREVNAAAPVVQDASPLPPPDVALRVMTWQRKSDIAHGLESAWRAFQESQSRGVAYAGADPNGVGLRPLRSTQEDDVACERPSDRAKARAAVERAKLEDARRGRAMRSTTHVDPTHRADDAVRSAVNRGGSAAVKATRVPSYAQLQKRVPREAPPPSARRDGPRIVTQPVEGGRRTLQKLAGGQVTPHYYYAADP